MPGVDLVTIADRLIATLSASDWPQLVELVAPGIHYGETGTRRQVTGTEPYIQFCQAWKQVFT